MWAGLSALALALLILIAVLSTPPRTEYPDLPRADWGAPDRVDKYKDY